jgi:hypothetical protein
MNNEDALRLRIRQLEREVARLTECQQLLEERIQLADQLIGELSPSRRDVLRYKGLINE